MPPLSWLTSCGRKGGHCKCSLEMYNPCKVCAEAFCSIFNLSPPLPPPRPDLEQLELCGFVKCRIDISTISVAVAKEMEVKGETNEQVVTSE